MDSVKTQWVEIIAQGLAKAAAGKGLTLEKIEDRIIVEHPPRPELGDLAFPMFPFAKDFKTGPPVIAGLVAEALGSISAGSVKTAGPYLNAFLDRAAVTGDLLRDVNPVPNPTENQIC